VYIASLRNSRCSPRIELSDCPGDKSRSIAGDIRPDSPTATAAGWLYANLVTAPAASKTGAASLCSEKDPEVHGTSGGRGSQTAGWQAAQASGSFVRRTAADSGRKSSNVSHFHRHDQANRPRREGANDSHAVGHTKREGAGDTNANCGQPADGSHARPRTKCEAAGRTGSDRENHHAKCDGTDVLGEAAGRTGSDRKDHNAEREGTDDQGADGACSGRAYALKSPAYCRRVPSTSDPWYGTDAPVGGCR
jgi:hypothetical protein